MRAKPGVAKYLFCFLTLTFLTFILVGCSHKSNNNQTLNQTSEPTIYYQMQETSLPNPDDALLAELSSNGYARELDLLLSDNTVYRIATTWDTIDGMTQTTGYYLQTLKAPYEEWETTLMPSSLWDPTLEYEGFQIQPYKFVSASHEKIVFQVKQYNEDLERTFHLGTYTKAEGATLSDPLPIEENSELLIASDGKIYVYSQVPDNSLMMLAENLETVWQKNMDGQIYGLLESTDQNVYWYGSKDNGYGCFSIQNGTALCGEYQDLNLLQKATLDNGNNLIFTDSYRIVEFASGKTKETELCNLKQRNYLLDSVMDLNAPSEDSLSLLCSMDGETLLLQMHESTKPEVEKQQITLAMPFEVSIVDYYIARFNRTNDEYEVVLLLPDKDTNGLTFGEQIQLEFMATIRNSDAQALAYGYDGMMNVLYFGLLDNDNKEFIDWVKGKSHLADAPFVEFLEFAYEYSSSQDMDMDDVGKAIKEGYFASVASDYNITHLNYIHECFSENDSIIGFPRSSGKGIYASANMLYLNSNSSVKEGAIEFLKFISSKEMQMKYAENSSRHKMTKAYADSLCIRKDALEKQISIKKAERPSEYLSKMNGIEFQALGLSEEREEVFRFLLENAEPANYNITPLLSIVSEELDPFFNGQCTAKEAANKLNNRVQLYLDENTP